MNKKKRPHCIECGAIFEAGEEMYSRDGGLVCSDCLDELFSELTRYEKARLLGCDVTFCGEVF